MPKRKGVSQEQNRRAICSATVELICEGGLSHATVARISERAAVDRSTFYRNFGTREDAVRAWYSYITMDGVKSLPKHPMGRAEYLEHLFDGCWEHRGELLSLHAHGLTVLMLDSISSLFMQQMDPSSGIVEQEAMYYHIGGVFNSLKLWLDMGMNMDPHEFAYVCATVADSGIIPAVLGNGRVG